MTALSSSSESNNNHNNKSSFCDRLCHRLPWYWFPSLVFAVAAWAGSYIVNHNCSFIQLVKQDENGGSDIVVERGTQRGQLLPGDACQPWGEYEDLDPDKYMTVTSVSSSLTLVLGAVVLAILVLVYPFCSNSQHHNGCCTARTLFQWMAVLLAVACAVFQAMTHFITQSDLCKDSALFLKEGFDCVHDQSFTYSLTFVNLGAWTLVAILLVDCACCNNSSSNRIGGGGSSTNSSNSQCDNDDDPELEHTQESQDDDDDDEWQNKNNRMDSPMTMCSI